MGETFVLSPWSTVKGTTASTSDIVQRRETWADCMSFKEAVISVQILDHTNCTVTIQTSLAPEGPWTDLFDFTAVTNTTKYATSREGGSTQFDRYLRWKIDRSVASWLATFKIEVNAL